MLQTLSRTERGKETLDPRRWNYPDLQAEVDQLQAKIDQATGYVEEMRKSTNKVSQSQVIPIRLVPVHNPN